MTSCGAIESSSSRLYPSFLHAVSLMSMTFMRTGSRSHIISSDASMAVRKRRSSSSCCLPCRNWPIWLPITLIACISRSSGSRTSRLLKASTPIVLPSDMTGKTNAPRIPMPRASPT